jgi:hypothetical protein
MKVKCPKCGKEGTLTRRLTISNNKRYFYLYVQHVQTVEGKTKRVWHYYGKLKMSKNLYTKMIRTIHKPSLETKSLILSLIVKRTQTRLLKP